MTPAAGPRAGHATAQGLSFGRTTPCPEDLGKHTASEQSTDRHAAWAGPLEVPLFTRGVHRAPANTVFARHCLRPDLREVVGCPGEYIFARHCLRLDLREVAAGRSLQGGGGGLPTLYCGLRP